MNEDLPPELEDEQTLENEPVTKVWPSETIQMVRIASTPGGTSMTPEEAREFRDELEAAIEQVEEWIANE
jgi:hypothetical protein